MVRPTVVERTAKGRQAGRHRQYFLTAVLVLVSAIIFCQSIVTGKLSIVNIFDISKAFCAAHYDGKFQQNADFSITFLTAVQGNMTDPRCRRFQGISVRM